MQKLFFTAFLAVIVAILAGGCRSQDTGSREFIPGKGWVPA